MLNIDNGYYKQLLNSQDSVEKAVLELIDGVSEKCLFIIDQERKPLGSLTDGDIRRSILRGISFKSDVLKVL